MVDQYNSGIELSTARYVSAHKRSVEDFSAAKQTITEVIQWHPIERERANDAVDDRDDDHDLHTGINCAHCGVLYDTDHVYVIHHHDCPYHALNPQLHSSMGDNLHVRDQSTSQLCIGETRPHLLVFDSRDELVISGQ